MITEDHAERTQETYGVRRAIRVLKDAVPIETYAATLSALRPSGGSLRGRCPVHKGDNEGAFLVDPDQRRWHCFRCSTGGDLIDLCQAVEGGEVWEAVISLGRIDI
jgi:DNA primase